jgi:c-di-GMP-binding flagellar brake protein YcgR
MSVEKRRYKRFSVEGMNIHTKVIFDEMIELSNISVSGACLITTKILRHGDNVLLRIPYEKIYSPLKCTVIWENVSESVTDTKENYATLYKAGIQFKEVSSNTLVQLKDFMRVSGIPDEKKLSDEYQPSALRFNIHMNKRALLIYPAIYPVKKLSLGGMLVETNCELEIEDKYPMALYIPKEDLPIKFQGRIASKIAIPDEKLNHFDIGIEFLNLAENHRSRLNKFISCL